MDLNKLVLVLNKRLEHKEMLCLLNTLNDKNKTKLLERYLLECTPPELE